MPDIVTFDAPSLRIVEISAAGDNTLDATEIYSEWKEWTKTGNNISHPPAFDVVGGEPISPTESFSGSFFLKNGWKIRPAELDHKLTIEGNLFTIPAGESAFVPTFGAYTVNAETRVSAVVRTLDSLILQQTITGTGLTVDEALALIPGLDEFVRGGRDIDFTGNDSLGWQKIERDTSGVEVARYNLFDEANSRITKSVHQFLTDGQMIAKEVKL